MRSAVKIGFLSSTKTMDEVMPMSTVTISDCLMLSTNGQLGIFNILLTISKRHLASYQIAYYLLSLGNFE